MRTSSDGTITLRDGRRLGYAEYGDRDGDVLFYFHGTPGSRLESVFLADAAAANRIRLIAVDRPGFGTSDFKPKRRFLDWPDDLVELADALRIGRFAVAGLSGGGPHAAACALRIPDRLTATAILSGDTPVPMLLDATRGRFKRLLLRVTLAMTPITARIGAAYLAWTARYLRGWMIPRFIDPHVLARGESRDVWRRSTQESVRHGGRGVAHEYVLFSRPWGFEPADIRAHVLLWHGESDHIVPVAAARLMAAALPSCDARFIADAGHLMFAERAAEIVSAIAAQTAVAGEHDAAI